MRARARPKANRRPCRVAVRAGGAEADADVDVTGYMRGRGARGQGWRSPARAGLLAGSRLARARGGRGTRPGVGTHVAVAVASPPPPPSPGTEKPWRAGLPLGFDLPVSAGAHAGRGSDLCAFSFPCRGARTGMPTGYRPGAGFASGASARPGTKWREQTRRGVPMWFGAATLIRWPARLPARAGAGSQGCI